MFSTVKKLAVFCIIVCALNIFVGIAVISFLASSNIGFTAIFSTIAYVITTSAVLLAVSCALYSASQDVQLDTDFTLTQITDIKKRLEELEKK